MKFRYQATLFADLSAVDASPSIIIQALKNLSERQISLLPTTIHEFVPSKMTPEVRLRFASPQGDTELQVLRGRIDFIQYSRDFDESALGTIEQFADFAKNCMESILDIKKISGSRIAFIAQYIDRDLSPQELENKYKFFFKPIDYYEQQLPIEWTFRANARQDIELKESKETVNSILKVDKANVQLQMNGNLVSFDGIVSEIDINTLVENENSRFNGESMRSFIIAASAVGDTIYQSFSQ